MKQKDTLQEAKLYFASGQLNESIEKFNVAEREQGHDTVDLCLSRGAARVALGKYKEAEDDFTRVLAEDTENERAYYFRGITRAAQGKYENAIQDLTLSLIRNNDRGIAHLVRGLAYSELGKENDAVLDFNSASAFSNAELQSFKRLFGDTVSPFKNTQALLAEENAPWNNLLTVGSADKLRKLLQHGEARE